PLVTGVQTCALPISLHAATAAGQLEAFRHRCAGMDLLLIDDVQFLSNRRETQAELLKVVAEMRAGGRQLVVTSDHPAAEIANLRSEERRVGKECGAR